MVGPPVHFGGLYADLNNVVSFHPARHRLVIRQQFAARYNPMTQEVLHESYHRGW